MVAPMRPHYRKDCSMNLGPMEIIVILVVVLLIFGPKNLPKLGSALGKTVKNVREGMEGDDEEKKSDNVEDVVAEEESTSASADEDEGKFCPKCGAKNASDATFCSKCGAKLN